MIVIFNTSKLLPEKSTYHLQINDKFICEFKHNRSKGLAECLRQAADAVEKHEKNKFIHIYNEIQKLE
jgi:hypothetical protein